MPQGRKSSEKPRTEGKKVITQDSYFYHAESITFKNTSYRAGERGQWLSMLAALAAEDSIPSTHVEYHTTHQLPGI